MHSEDGLDEITTTGPTEVVEVFAGTDESRRYTVTPGGVRTGARRRSTTCAAATRPRTPRCCAPCSKAKPEHGATSCVLNAGAALYIAEAASSIGAGVELARRAIDSGAALAKLDALVRVTGELAETDAGG